MIREVKEDELTQVLELHKHLHPLDDPLPDMKTVSDIWRSLVRDPNIHHFVCEEDGRFVSLCHLVIVPNLTRGCRPYGLVENVVTHADFRQRGFGTAVLKHALSYAWDAGCYKVMLLTSSKQEGIDAFYEKAGFRKGVKTGFDARPPIET